MHDLLHTNSFHSGPFPTEQLNEIGEKLQKTGHEVGVTVSSPVYHPYLLLTPHQTGRTRRCGWLDLVVVKYSHEVNGYSSLNLTKLDILDDFDTIEVATAYIHPESGEELPSFPANQKVLAGAKMKYTTLPGWKKSTFGVKTWFDLPVNARKYVEFIEQFVGVKVKYIGTGPDREHMIYRDALPV
jgi:adenylosuccinate synthase